MPNHIYCCAECGETKSGFTSPKSGNCPQSSFHRWINLGMEGNQEYECSHCKVKVTTTKPPATYGCRKNLFHEWKEIPDKKRL